MRREPHPNLRKRKKEITPMKDRYRLLIGSAALAGMLAVAGCNRQFPDEKTSVTNAMSTNNLSSVTVSQDRQKGVMTLTGNVAFDHQKTQAENLAKQAAPDYTIANEIGVQPPGDQSQAQAVSSSLDSAIEDNFKATLKAHKNLDNQSISYKAKNGTLLLKGSVKTERQKAEAAKLAKKVPNVQQVVNEIEVKPTKHSTANS
ncbi:MAG: BON domain-containing protein [Terracidiphilus sp.]